MEDLMGFPYLDAVVRETLRLHSPVASLAKVAMKDDLIPLDVPFIDIKGNTQRAIRYIFTFERKRTELTIRYQSQKG
jgi:Cytochrome P450